MKIKSIDSIKNLDEALVLVRVDFNVPLAKGRVKETFKIKSCLPLIERLVKARAKIILISHLGEPKLSKTGRVATADRQATSLEPVAKSLAKLLGRKVKFSAKLIGSSALDKELDLLKAGEVILLENLRFYPGETKDDKAFAKALASIADVYVNNAFAVSHRQHASVARVKKYLPSFAGPLLVTEITNLNKIIKPEKPLIAVIGGAKIDTKVALVKRLAQKADWLIIGGALANNFIAAQGYEVGKSLVTPEGISLAKRLMKRNIVIPHDLVVQDQRTKQSTVKTLDQVAINDMILDIGPATMKRCSDLIKTAKTIVWNGPMGKFEDPKFKHGTMFMARAIASRASGRAFAVVGGGETVEAINLSHSADQIDWISTGGGASLSYLSGEAMPGIKGLIK